VVPLGINAPNDDSTDALFQSGAAHVLLNLEELRDIIKMPDSTSASSSSSSSSAASAASAAAGRTATVNRSTKETVIKCSVNLDGTGVSEVDTGIGFFDHMLTALSKHSKIDIRLECDGDLEVDDHHTVEDCALALGACIDQALGDKRGIRRYGSAYAPLDEALARAVIDFSGRASAQVCLSLSQIFTHRCSSFLPDNSLYLLLSFLRLTCNSLAKWSAPSLLRC
jgi:imidazoleglycerol phosphate dehydratase HisB